METNVYYEVFEYNDEVHIFELEPGYSELVNEVNYRLLREAFWGGFTDGKAIYIDKFLRDDLSINLEKLELAVLLSAEYLEITTAFDEPIILKISGFDTYCELRGITKLPRNVKEEYYVIKGIVDAVANQESSKPVRVEYVSDSTQSFAR